MIREQIARAAVRAYPQTLRTASDQELVATLLEAGDRSSISFLRELVSLVVAGVVGRSRRDASRPLSSAAADAVKWASIVSVVWWMFEMLDQGDYIVWPSSASSLWTDIFGPALVLACFTVGRERIAGLLGVVWLGSRLDQLLSQFPWLGHFSFLWIPPEEWGLLQIVVPLVGFAVMLLAPRRGISTERTLWLLLLPVFALHERLLTSHAAASRIELGLAFLVLLLIQPAFGVGVALLAASLAAHVLLWPHRELSLFMDTLLACVPLAVLRIGLQRQLIASRQ
jgi:hypothetical protein